MASSATPESPVKASHPDATETSSTVAAIKSSSDGPEGYTVDVPLPSSESAPTEPIPQQPVQDVSTHTGPALQESDIPTPKVLPADHQPTSAPSPTPSPQPQQPQQPQQPSQPPQPTQASGPAAELQTMFPDLDLGVIEAVLQAHGNDPSQSISALLAMSDPNYKPTAQDTVDDDEALARRLAAEDEEAAGLQAAGSWQPQAPGPHPQAYPQQQGQYTNLPYQARIRPPYSQTGVVPQGPGQGSNPSPGTTIPGWQPGLSQGGKDEIQKLQEEFTRFAGVGKKTMTDWFGKAKAKVAELQASRHEQSQIQAENENSSQNQSSSAPYNWGAAGQTLSQPSSNARAGSNTNNNSPRTTRMTNALPHASRYDSQPSQASAPGTGIQAGSGMSPAPGNTDPARAEFGQTASEPLYNSAGPNATIRPTPATQPTPAGGAGTGAATKVAGAAAIGAGAGSAGGAIAQRDDDEDSLEYTRNPFEDDD